jgi:HSP20 family protein
MVGQKITRRNDMWTQIINRRPDGIDLFRSQLNRLFSDFDEAYTGFERHPAAAPHTNMYDDGNQFVLKAEVPGMSKDDLQIKIQGNYLELSGSNQSDTPEGYKAHRVERTATAFTRSFTLTTDVDADKVEAELGDGILTLTLPKVEAAKPRQVAIK